MGIPRVITAMTLTLFAVSGCATHSAPTASPASQPLSFQNDLQMVTADDNRQAMVLDYDINASGIAPKGQINTWAEKLVNELVLQNDGLQSTQPLVVATPVMTEDYDQTNTLGMQLQQGLMTAFHAHEFNVVDLNVANAIRVTHHGEFLLSRDWKKLPGDLPVAHVLVSTMSLTPEGILFNGRIVNITNNRVVSSVQSFVNGQSLSGYLQAPQRIETRDGLLYRHETAQNGRYTILGDKQ
ncbi:FlgO family outer membrane protein [Shewanella intestini]|nr:MULTISPECIES: FlgO family outer membrane protein [Shewanella]